MQIIDDINEALRDNPGFASASLTKSEQGVLSIQFVPDGEALTAGPIITIGNVDEADIGLTPAE